MSVDEFFDVLSITDENGNVDMIQVLMGNDCLGSHFINGTAKLYFQSGLKNKLEKKLQKINSNYSFDWGWEKQNKEDWHLIWQDNFQPVIINEKLAVIPYWCNDSPADIVIKIKPGMAFGTGHHETTWLMLCQMIKHIKPGMTVLDLGTGSGILSIASIKLGAKKVDGVEFDRACGTNFKENQNLNHMGNKIHYHHKNVLTWNNFDYDIILANINKNVINDLIPRFKKTKAKVILSGLLETDFEFIKSKCNANKLIISETILKEEWICLIINYHD